MTMQSFIPRVILFHWGDALKEVLHDHKELTAEWQKKNNIKSPQIGLMNLSKLFPCYVLVNGMNSDVESVQASLEKGGLNHLCSGVLPYRETDCEKDDPYFYKKIARQLNLPLESMVMIADDYQQFILTAHEAGMKTVWISSADLDKKYSPVHDAEINGLDEVSADCLSHFSPTIETCLLWLNEHSIPDNIMAHMQSVAMFAYHLSSSLKRKGFTTDPIVVHRAALLHDIGKMLGWRNEQDHAVIGGQILRDKGCPRLAEIIEMHNISRILSSESGGWDLDTKLVYYADKRFKGSTQVDISTRIGDMAERHPEKGIAFGTMLDKISNLENDINNMMYKY